MNLAVCISTASNVELSTKREHCRVLLLIRRKVEQPLKSWFCWSPILKLNQVDGFGLDEEVNFDTLRIFAGMGTL